jgi:hypothetical protein
VESGFRRTRSARRVRASPGPGSSSRGRLLESRAVEVEAAPDGALVLSYDSTRLSRLLLIVSAAMFAGAGYHLLSDRGDSARLIGFLGGAVTCAAIALLCVEQARVVVDSATRTVVWTRRGAFRTRRGTLSFDDISAVYAERPRGDSGIPSRRVVIFTRGGETVPLTAGYRPDGDRVILGASEHMRAMLGQDPASTDTAQAMVTAGRVRDAIAFLRDAEGLSLTDARKRIDALRRPH